MSRKQTLRYPLRQVIRTEQELIGVTNSIRVYCIMEVLECGHRQRIRSDIYGEYHATRRRCRQCWDEQNK